MGVTVSSQRPKKPVKRVPPPSFASFSTTGTLTTSAYVDEGEIESKIALSTEANMLIYLCLCLIRFCLKGRIICFYDSIFYALNTCQKMTAISL